MSNLKQITENPNQNININEDSKNYELPTKTFPFIPKYITKDEAEEYINQWNNAHFKRYIEENSLRKRLSYIFVGFAAIWILFMIAIVVLCGFQYYNFKLESCLLITLVTTSSATVFGLAVIVAKYFLEKNPNLFKR